MTHKFECSVREREARVVYMSKVGSVTIMAPAPQRLGEVYGSDDCLVDVSVPVEVLAQMALDVVVDVVEGCSRVAVELDALCADVDTVDVIEIEKLLDESLNLLGKARKPLLEIVRPDRAVARDHF